MPPGLPPGLPAWPWAILGALDAERVHLGFSEYASYASWALQRSPPAAVAAPRRSWRRHPPGGPLRLLLQARRRPPHPSWSPCSGHQQRGLPHPVQALHDPGRRCCPSRALLASLHRAGWQYVGFEAGHVALCRYGGADSGHGGYGLAADPPAGGGG